jgi:hypothetical protein
MDEAVVVKQSTSIQEPSSWCEFVSYKDSNENRQFLGIDSDVMKNIKVTPYLITKYRTSIMGEPSISTDGKKTLMGLVGTLDIDGVSDNPPAIMGEPSMSTGNHPPPPPQKGGDGDGDDVPSILESTASAFEKVTFFAHHAFLNKNKNSSAESGIPHAENLRMTQFIRSYKYNYNYERSREPNTTIRVKSPAPNDPPAIKWTFISNHDINHPEAFAIPWANSGPSVVKEIGIIALGRDNMGVQKQTSSLPVSVFNNNRQPEKQNPHMKSRLDTKHLTSAIFLNVLRDIKDDKLDTLCHNLECSNDTILKLKAIRNDATFKELFNGGVVPMHCIEEIVSRDGDKFNIYTSISQNVPNIVSQSIKYDKDLTIFMDGDVTPDYKSMNTDESKSILTQWIARMYQYCIKNGSMDGYLDGDATATCVVFSNNGNGDIINNVLRGTQHTIQNSKNLVDYDVVHADTIGGAPVKWIPDKSNGAGHGNITVTNNKQDLTVFYDKDTKNSSGSMIPGEPRQLKTTTSLCTSTGEKATRIKDPRDAMMGFFSDLVYNPNDVVENVSKEIFNIDKFDWKSRWTNDNKPPENGFYIYVGGVYPDPETPYAFMSGDEVEKSSAKPSYYLLHAWLYINTKQGTEQGTNAHPCELYIVTRGSKSRLDWSDTDHNILATVGLVNDRALQMAHCVTLLLKKANNIYGTIDGTNSNESGETPWQNVKNKHLQIYSVGHSLGGFLSLAVSFYSISRSFLSNFHSTNIRASNSPIYSANLTNWILNPFICPIVFDPFVPPTNTQPINMFHMIPNGTIHSVWSETKRNRDFASAIGAMNYPSFVESNERNGHLHQYKYMSVFDAVDKGGANISEKLWTDVGGKGIMRRTGLDRTFAGIVTSHSMDQMTGLNMTKYLKLTLTSLYVKNGENTQSIQPMQSAEFPTFIRIRDDTAIDGIVKISKKELSPIVAQSEGPEDKFYDAQEELQYGGIRRRKTKRHRKSRKLKKNSVRRKRTRGVRRTQRKSRKQNRNKTSRKKYR